jgi:D-alanine-D-alanine ligase
LVFNIAEGMHGLAREAQVPALLDLYQIPYTFSDPLVLALTLHKGLTKTVVRAGGLPTPDFALVERPEDVQRVALPWPLFAKPVAEGTGKGINPASKISDRESLDRICRQLLAKYRQPVLVETFLPGREFTVGIAGTGPAAEVLGSMEITLLPGAEAGVYSYVNKERCEELCRYDPGLPERDDEVRQAEALALTAYRVLGCRDAGRVDLRSDARGRPQFIEVNPLAGMHPLHSDLPIICTMKGIPYHALIERILASAAERMRD